MYIFDPSIMYIFVVAKANHTTLKNAGLENLT